MKREIPNGICVQVPYSTEFRTNQSRNSTESAGVYIFTPLSKVWSSRRLFSWNSRLFDKFRTLTSVPKNPENPASGLVADTESQAAGKKDSRF